ncbi:MAG: hypothetical protein PHI11_04400 [Gallionella sp.]|nr:hypothetical protein [Gallionella sp.]
MKLYDQLKLARSENDLEWNGKKWSLVNHFIPYTEVEIGAPDHFESDFMVQYLAGLPAFSPIPTPTLPLKGRELSSAPFNGEARSFGSTQHPQAELSSSPFKGEARWGMGVSRNEGLSAEALAVLDAGRVLWQAYFAHTDVRTVRDELKLNRSDVGWYQIRNALKARNSSGDTLPVDFTPFESAYQTLSEKLRPQVFELGFLR